MNLYKMSELLDLNINLVGTKHGVDFDFIERVIDVSGHPIVVAGGIKNNEDLDTLEDLGAAGVILSTAIHEEIIPARSPSDREQKTKKDDQSGKARQFSAPKRSLQDWQVPSDLVSDTWMRYSSHSFFLSWMKRSKT